MRLDIAYGKGYLPIELDRYDTERISPKSAIEIQDIDRHIQEKISHSNLCSEITGLDRDSKVVIVLDNPQKIFHISSILESLLNTFKSTAIDFSFIQLLISYPNYSNIKFEDMMSNLSDFISEGCGVHIHDPTNDKLLRYMGDEPIHSIPVYLNLRYVESSYRISVGAVMQSAFTGTTGGYLSISPGMVGARTSHYLAKNLFRYESTTFQCNPHYQQLLQSITNFASPDQYLNIVQDWSGTIAHVAFGPIDLVAKDCFDVARNLATSMMKKRCDIAIVGAGGSGYDDTLFDACESLYSGYSATRTGGTILLVAECGSGVGPEGFLEGLANAQSEMDFTVMIETGFKPGMERARFLRRVMANREVVLCTRLRESLVVEKIGCNAVRDPEEGMEMIMKSNGSSSRIAVIGNGQFVDPHVV